jgi:hypothetical protein
MAALGADETTRKAAQITNYLAFRKGAWADYIAYVFVFVGSIIYYLSNVQINPFIPSSSHSATERRSFRFKAQIFGQSALAGGGGGTKKFFTGARNRCRRSWNTFLRALEVVAWVVRGRYEHNKMWNLEADIDMQWSTSQLNAIWSRKKNATFRSDTWPPYSWCWLFCYSYPLPLIVSFEMISKLNTRSYLRFEFVAVRGDIWGCDSCNYDICFRLGCDAVQLGTQIPTLQRNVEYHCEGLYHTTRRHISEDDNLCGPTFRCTRKRVSVEEKLSGVFVMCGQRTVNVYSHLTFIPCLWKKNVQPDCQYCTSIIDVAECCGRSGQQSPGRDKVGGKNECFK